MQAARHELEAEDRMYMQMMRKIEFMLGVVL